VMHEWHKSLLHNVVPSLIKKWELKLKVKVAGYFLQRMKTKWGSCNHKAGHIRLNTEPDLHWRGLADVYPAALIAGRGGRI
jgi:predicted metal-dependent hydrolase